MIVGFCTEDVEVDARFLRWKFRRGSEAVPCGAVGWCAVMGIRPDRLGNCEVECGLGLGHTKPVAPKRQLADPRPDEVSLTIPSIMETA